MRAFVFLLLLTCVPSAASAQNRPLCHDWTECRQFALKAYADHDFEAFYDFARRSLAAGPPRDAQLMFLLARAQSRSGRPDDAIQMLGRLALMGVATDATTSMEFEPVRAAEGWPALKATLESLKPRLRLSSPAFVAGAASAFAPGAGTADKSAGKPGDAPVASASAATGAMADKPAASASAAMADKPDAVQTALRIPATMITPTGLAYDHVSGRFLMADRDSHKLVSVDELSRHMVDLVKADSAGFREITAFEIDTRRGDLWVVSAGALAGADQATATALHKLQLISGRPLARYPLDASYGDARFEDLAVSRAGSVFALDGHGGRIFRLAPRSSALALACRLHLDRPVSLALTGDRSAFVAFATGLARVDLVSGRAVKVTSSRTLPLEGLERIRSDHGRIVGTQRSADGMRHVVSIRLTSGPAPRATAIERLDGVEPLAGGTLTALSGDDLYFLTKEAGHGGEDGEFVVRRAHLP